MTANPGVPPSFVRLYFCHHLIPHLNLNLPFFKINIDATHIFDGLNDFPTHIAHMRFGSFVTEPSSWPITDESALATQFPPTTSLFNVALQWLKEDKHYRQELEKQGIKRARGVRINEASTYSAI